MTASLSSPEPHRVDSTLGGAGGLFIDGTLREAANGRQFAVVDPATEETFSHVADGSASDAVTACDAAERVLGGWAATPPRERSEILRACWAALLTDTDHLASLITREQGKPLTDAVDEVRYAAEFFRWSAEATVRISGTHMTSPSGSHRILVRHVPIGVVAVITPWNFPAAMIARKIAPAIGAGNSVVIKPAAETPLTALAIADIAHRAGVPAGVINVVPTTEPTAWFDAVAGHPAVRMLSFTGSTAVGRLLLRRSADRILKTTMELGGNAPFLVLADADLDVAVAAGVAAKMRHGAQTCTAANRFIVEQAIVTDFTLMLAARLDALEVGNGFDAGVDCGPLITAEARARVGGLVTRAIAEGATPMTHRELAQDVGYFYPPTVLSGVDPSSAIARTEIFGPVAPVIEATDLDSMVKIANATEQGLAAYVCTGDVGRGLAIAERLEHGMVAINRSALSDPAAPFGGMKQSGLGREGGIDGILEFCETQYLAASWTEQ